MSEASATATPAADERASAFIARWEGSSSAERANYQLFLSELCDVLGVPRPDPSRPDDRENAYVFERTVHFDHGGGETSIGRIDLYKRGCFVLEAKQGSDAEAAGGGLFSPAPHTKRGTAVRGTTAWSAAMLKARNKTREYVGALPPAEGNPPFILVVDVGHTFELYADFSRLGKTYTPFPDSQTHRLKLADLSRPEVRRRLALVWTDPLVLDPARHSAKVTRDVAARLAALAKGLEAAGHHAETVAAFLMRCLFTLFAEDVKLIEGNAFTELLKSMRGKPEQFPHLVRMVWKEMDQGAEMSLILRKKLLRFNGGLFEQSDALPLTSEQLELLIEAAEADWSEVEPAIFGTLLERALNDRERQKLGAHFTPRAYVERLVLPTVIEPLREQWAAAQAAAFTLAFQGRAEDARRELHTFLETLCGTIVLDPACGTGNFLYVTMEHMKRIEGEVRDALDQLGETQPVLERGGLTVSPHQFLGLEINPRAVAIADLVLWIGYLQWHFRTRGRALLAEPVLKAFHNIRDRDAVLAYDRKEVALDQSGTPLTRWDGRTKKVSPLTGEELPDETARVPAYRYISPRAAEWPRADYVVGNPPFIGNKRMRLALGDGYVEALRRAHPDVPEASDFVMYWWNWAARLARTGKIKRFGLITTNAIKMSFNRRVVEQHLRADKGFGIAFAVADHPWVDSADGAAVRIAMTVGRAGSRRGVVSRVTAERTGPEGETAVELSACVGEINPDLTIGVDVTDAVRLASNRGLACPGVQLSGQGFVVGADDVKRFGAATRSDLVKPYLIGNDIVKRPRGDFVLDAFGLRETDLRGKYPDAYQWLRDRVKPERDQNPRETYRRNWWIYSEPRARFRATRAGLKRVIAVCRTAKHRAFTFVDARTVAETTVVTVALDDALFLGTLSSRFHEVWILLAAKATLEDRPRYNVSVCFDPFPFPACTAATTLRIRELAESLDAHRKRQQAAHPGLTITDMYNVLEKLRRAEPLTDKDKRVHEQGLVSVLRQIHDDLDAAVADAYGWPADLPDEEVLRRLVALNAERAEEERRGLVRWLRPEFQNPGGSARQRQGALALPDAPNAAKSKPAAKAEWPRSLAEQARAVRAALLSLGRPATAADVARSFRQARADKVGELLETLTALGQARSAGDGRYAA